MFSKMKKLAVGTALTVATLPAMAAGAGASGNIWDGAVAEITSLKGGVVAVGTVILAISVASVGFFVIRRMVSRA